MHETYSPESDPDGIDLKAIVLQVIADSQGVDANEIDLDVKLEEIDIESLDLLDISMHLAQHGITVDADELRALWNGQVPVTGALSHVDAEHGVRRAKPLEGKENEPLPQPTVNDLITAAHAKMSSLAIVQ